MKTKIGLMVGVVMAVAVAAVRGESPASGRLQGEGRAGACCAVAPKAEAGLSERSLYQVEARFTNDAGESVALAELRGRPVVLTMFFANCSYACPLLVSDMARLRAALPEGVREEVRFVLVSFDAERDTPEALRAYRERVGLDAQWMLWHGEAESVQELAMVLGIKYKREASGEYAHSNLLTVLNREGEVVHRVEGLQQPVAAAARALTVAAK